MNFNLVEQLRSHKFGVMNIIFYFLFALLATVVICYVIFSYKITAMNQDISSLDEKMLVYASTEQKTAEKEVLSYKKMVDDFIDIINNHRISSNVFTFIEQKTLPNVWYVSFSVSETKKEINLLGEAQNMEALSNQIKIFETSKDYVNNITVLNSQITPQKRIRFTLSLSLKPEIFKGTIL
ncbi:MAG: hypothetical protein EXS48_01100 [Candidatus Staskawiczbacteria bacterium]|nr:hypothetical protein [Candidatus Staskawiczbacteria bacterium]